MSESRLAASVEVSSLLRRAEQQGDFAAVLRKGDAERGAILIVVRSRGAYVATLERSLQANGRYAWGTAGPGAEETAEKLAEFLTKRRSFDADLWLIELDVAQPERFIAETTSAG